MGPSIEKGNFDSSRADSSPESKKIDSLLQEAQDNGLTDEINMGPDDEGKMNAEAAIHLGRLNAEGWQADWQKKNKQEKA